MAGLCFKKKSEMVNNCFIHKATGLTFTCLKSP